MRTSAPLSTGPGFVAALALAGVLAASASADPVNVTALPAPRVQVVVQGADDVEHYVARQVGMGYLEAASAARRPIAQGRVTDVEVWLTPNQPSRYRAWISMGAASFAVICPPEQCHTPYDLGKRVAAEVAARQSGLLATGVARGEASGRRP
jgi:hypothetical protein